MHLETRWRNRHILWEHNQNHYTPHPSSHLPQALQIDTPLYSYQYFACLYNTAKQPDSQLLKTSCHGDGDAWMYVVDVKMSSPFNLADYLWCLRLCYVSTPHCAFISSKQGLEGKKDILKSDFQAGVRRAKIEVCVPLSWALCCLEQAQAPRGSCQR